jgi:hypothetical protein
MLLSQFAILACVGMGGGAAALTGYPLYLGFLAGWVCQPPVVMLVIGGMTKGHWRIAPSAPCPPKLAVHERERRNASLSAHGQ